MAVAPISTVSQELNVPVEEELKWGRRAIILRVLQANATLALLPSVVIAQPLVPGVRHAQHRIPFSHLVLVALTPTPTMMLPWHLGPRSPAALGPSAPRRRGFQEIRTREIAMLVTLPLARTLAFLAQALVLALLPHPNVTLRRSSSRLRQRNDLCLT